ncbi:MAG: hypothetical protein OHK0011_00300 [Turneriella sp.]
MSVSDDSVACEAVLNTLERAAVERNDGSAALRGAYEWLYVPTDAGDA